MLFDYDYDDEDDDEVKNRTPSCIHSFGFLYCTPRIAEADKVSTSFAQTADKIDVRYVAHLARLYLTEDEAATFQGQLEQVLQYVRELSALDVEGVEPTAHAMPIHNVFRADETRPCADREKVLANAPQERHGQFVVPRIIE